MNNNKRIKKIMRIRKWDNIKQISFRKIIINTKEQPTKFKKDIKYNSNNTVYIDNT